MRNYHTVQKVTDKEVSNRCFSIVRYMNNANELLGLHSISHSYQDTFFFL